ncbi:phosphoserine transaminase [Kocuria coralli]|uniref:phosphoserine transaminase n=1 Tax=Kocuria coralli TaxID=1461025 RepID=A0A5J5KYG4_9MICC|nr:phosphoserine transaminase [Kocuria coralli]KAA9394709.1 phosphoserine transaminase [Kocuria coralli]
MSRPVSIPDHLLPADGRFGSGPSKVREDQVGALARAGRGLLGTSHRQAPVKDAVGRIREGLGDFLQLPEGYEILLGMGGATAFWDSAAFGLVREKAQHAAFGEFGAKFASVTDGAPFLAPSTIRTAEPGTRTQVLAEEGVDVYAWPQNETSTGVMAPVRRPDGVERAVPGSRGPLVVVDATSAAGGAAVDLQETDVYYFSPQKNFASDGGLWFGAFSPAAIERIEEISASGRWIPDFLSLHSALENSRKNQTYNTPGLAGLVMLDDQVRWLNEQGGMAWAAARTKDSSDRVYTWAEASDLATPFVTRPEDRSTVVTTVDFHDDVDAAAISAALRAHGVVDVEPYRKLGRNQLRIATFTAVEPDDVSALLACIDVVAEQL